MTSRSPDRPKIQHSGFWYRTLLTANLVIMLFPPIHLGMANGSIDFALLYFMGSPVVLIISLFVLNRLANEGKNK